MSQTQVARLFRSPELGRLAGLAAAQGWDVSRLPGGHVAATNPSNGARVLMSGTGYVNHGTLRAKVHEFVQAGLDPDWTRKGARSRNRQEVRSVQVSAVERPTAAPITPATREAIVHRPGAHLSQGGRYAFVGDQEVLDVGGYQVRVAERADGQWVARTRDVSQARNVRQWYNVDRAALLARVAEDVVARPPVVEGPPRPRKAEAPIRHRKARAALEGVPPEVLATAPEVPQEGRLDRVAQGFHVVQAEAAEFPLAAGLDTLDATVAPAVAALRAAGRTDAADLLSEAAGPLSPVERELLALYRRLMRGE